MKAPVEALCDAARRGDTAQVAALLDQAPDSIHQLHEGATALHYAALAGQEAVVKLLLSRGADLHVRDLEFNSPPAGWANEAGHEGIVRLLVVAGTRYSACQAAGWGLAEELKAIVANDPESRDRFGGFGTPLHEAVIWGREEIAAWLISQGARLDSSTQSGKNALELAREQAGNGRTHTPLVRGERQREIEQACGRIAAILERALNGSDAAG